MDAERKRLLSAYLRGTLPEGERRLLEAGYAADDDLFEALVEVENDTIDAYARGTLPAAERAAFEGSAAATPSLRDRAAFARTLAASWDRVEPEGRAPDGPPGPGSGAAAPPSEGVHLTQARRVEPVRAAALAALAAAVLAIGVGLGVLLVTSLRLRGEMQALRDEQAVLRRTSRDLGDGMARLRQELERPPAPASRARAPAGTVRAPIVAPPAPRTAALRLFAGSGRDPGGPPNRVTLAGATVVELELELDPDLAEQAGYRASLQTAEGRPLWSRDRLRSRKSPDGGRVVVVRVPASLLARGDYVVRLTGHPRSGAAGSGATEPVDAYSFTVAPDGEGGD
jgi:hypothetical protein